LAAAAGSSGVAPKKFLWADGVGAMASIAEVLLVGYALGAAYKKADRWLTVAGVVVLLVLLVAIGRWLRRTD
jgi:membrane protein DedA with SNARE-associated domain